MEIKLNVPTYNPKNGIEYNWEKNFVIETKYENGAVIIFANKEGLISLANHLLNLAKETIPPNYHLHFDDLNSLEDGSIEVMIQKIK